jgi:hypothetical protein
VKEWDKSIDELSCTPLIDGSACLNIQYMKQKKGLGAKPRDFYEKTFQFIYEGKFYRYSSSIYSDNELSK